MIQKNEIMKKLTDSAQNTLKTELEIYKKFILKRSSFYADIDDSVVINDSHIQKAAEEYNGNFMTSKPLPEKRKNFLYFTMIFSLISIFVAVITLYSTFFNIFDITIVIISLSVLVLTLASFLILMKDNKKQKMSEKGKKVLKFLNKWDELEYQLSILYEKKYEKNPGNMRELLSLFVELPEAQKTENPEIFFSLLDFRNNIIHRNMKEISNKKLDKSIADVCRILDLLKKVELVSETNND